MSDVHHVILNIYDGLYIYAQIHTFKNSLLNVNECKTHTEKTAMEMQLSNKLNIAHYIIFDS